MPLSAHSKEKKLFWSVAWGTPMTPEIGYMQGHLTWHFGERLKALGVTIANTDPDKSTHLDPR
jgi:hypothetical protein